MITYAVLGSGSSGNGFLIAADGAAVLIDAGFSLRELQRRVACAGADFTDIQALFLTHMHPDHCRGCGVFARKTGKPVYVHRALAEQHSSLLEKLGIPSQLIRTFLPHYPVSLGPFSVEAFSTCHDSPYSVGYSLTVGGRTFSLLTDTGRVTDAMDLVVDRSDILFLEANHDEGMLERGPYPYYLKQRIAGDEGHLSNERAIDLLNRHAPGNGRLVYFCHLSRVNNDPAVLQNTCLTSLTWKGSYTICAHGELYTGEVAKKPEIGVGLLLPTRYGI